MSRSQGVGKKAALVAFFGLIVGVGTVYAESNIETTYHVYVNDKHLGTVEDKKIVETHIEEKIEKAEKTYGDWNLQTKEKVSFESENVFSPKYTEEKVLSSIDRQLDVVVEAVGLQVDGETVAYLPNKEKADQVIDQFTTRYVKPATLAAVEERKLDNKAVELESDESKVVDVQLSADVSHETKAVDPEQVSTVDLALQSLLTGKETLHLSKDHLMSAKPSDQSEDDGTTSEKTVKVSPLMDVIVKEKGIRTEVIPAEKEVVKTDELYEGESEIKQKGRDGEKEIHFTATFANGEVDQEEITKETITKEPVKEIVRQGTKDPSVGTGTFLWPAYGGTITSHLGERWGRMHKGIDIAGVTNRTIRAADYGTVVTAEYQNGFGNKVVIDHNNGYRTIYAHLSSIDVQVGQTVKKGDGLGIMGTTGNSTGIHLHFEIYKNGALKNPMDYL
ncbi:peptidoglycan DD-metalloendopeptidase family protein [Halobacillus locisalis]|uniref:Peptidoglycan DD-metalloendopeptidase family protein n=1 Tax=Halobacillus locisalis TaxID=220753 RepID=A0A838CRY0_9BACI|nr:peptidoglycan DD-metalloendopeptidase family protein [Halobacillus locisalis]MBA2174780.1 peptidoglycan DD-metalloendopeptidase family protein [Halobacillus locisalis]